MFKQTKLTKLKDDQRLVKVRAALKRCKNDVGLAAKDLGLSLSATYRYMRQFELPTPERTRRTK